MIAYRFYLLDSDGHLVKAHIAECSTDRQIIDTAEALLAAWVSARSIEVWDRARLVRRMERRTAASRAQPVS
jgi:hypothetical protein